MIAFAKNKEIGIKETVKHITYLYWFTFQQKQAQKAVLELAKNKEISHHLFLLLLESKNLQLVEALSLTNPMANLYYGLTEIKKKLTGARGNNFFSSFSEGSQRKIAWY
jgi:hypothetical protein